MLEKEEKWKDLIAVLEKLIPLTTDPTKILASTEKLANAWLKLKNPKEAGQVLESIIQSLNPESNVELDKEKEIDLLTRVANLYQQADSEFQNKEVELRRKRLGADPIDVIRTTVEKEATLSSRIEPVYKRLMDIAGKEWSDKLIAFMWRKLAIVKEKDSLREEILTMCKQTQEELPLEILLQVNDYPLSDIPKDLLGKASSFDTPFGQVCKSILNKDTISLSKSNLPSLLGQRALAQTSYETNDYENAIAYAQQAVSSVTTLSALAFASTDAFPKTKLDLALIQALSYSKMDPKFHRNDALTHFKRVLQRNDTHPTALLEMGMLLSKSYERHEEALKLFDKLLAQDSSNQLAREEKATVLVNLNRYDEAMEILQKVIAEQESSPESFSNARRAETQWRLGTCVWKRNEAEAFKHFLASAKLDTTFAPAYSSMGDYYRSISDSHRAEKCYTRAVQLDPLKADVAAKHLVEYALEKGDLDRVKLVCENVTLQNKRAGWAFSALGRVDLQSGRYSEAILALQMALRLDSKDHELWRMLGGAYKKEGKYTASVKAFSRALELKQTDEARFELACVKHELGWWDEAVQEYELLSASSARLAGIAACRLRSAKEALQTAAFGKCLVQLQNGFSAIEDGMKMEPKFQTWYKLLANGAMLLAKLPLESTQLPLVEMDALGDFIPIVEEEPRAKWTEVARKSLTHCIHLAKSGPSVGQGRLILASYFYDLGVCYREAHLSTRKEEYRDAGMNAVKRALNLNPGSEVYWNALGLLTTDDLLAQHAFIKALECNPNSVDAWTHLGFLYMRNHQEELALKAFSEAHKIDPESPEPVLGKAIVKQDRELAAHAWDLSGMIPESNYLYAVTREEPDVNVVFSLRRYLHQHPNDLSARNLLGLGMVRQGNYEDAIVEFDKLLEQDLAGYHAQVLVNRGRAKCCNGDFAEAVADLQKAVKLLPSQQVTYHLLLLFGICLYFDGKLVESIGKFKEAQQKGGDKLAITHLLAQILYALGTPAHLELAERQFRENADAGHLDSLLALGTMVALKKDYTACQTVQDELSKREGTRRVSMYISKVLAEASGEKLQLREEDALESHDVLRLAQVWFQQGKREASTLFKRALHAKPWLNEARIGLFHALMVENASGRVLQRIAQTIDLPLGKVFQCHALIAMAREGSEDLISEAFEMSEEIAEGGDYEAYGYLMMGRCLVLADDFDQAKEAFKKAIECKPELHEAWWELAWVYGEMGKLDASTELLTNPMVKCDYSQLLLAQLYTEHGQNDKSMALAGQLGDLPAARVLQAFSSVDAVRANKILSKLDLPMDILAILNEKYT